MKAGFAAALVLFLTGCWIEIENVIPSLDEGLEASQALTLATRGYLGAPQMTEDGFNPNWNGFPDPEGVPRAATPIKLINADRYTYYFMPAWMVSLAGWFRLTGFSLRAARWYSVLWGCIGIAALTLLVDRLTRNRRLALFSCFLLATNSLVINIATEARWDMMTAALGFSALAWFVAQRDRRPSIACAGSAFLLGLGLITHPGVAMEAVCLLYLMLRSGWRSLIRHLPAMALAFAVPLAAWGTYLLQAPNIAAAQWNAHTLVRLEALHRLPDNLRYEYTRYLHFFAAPDLEGLARLKILFLVIYLGALAVSFHPKLRKRPGVGLFASFTLLSALVLAFVDNGKFAGYLIHVIPFATLLVGAVLYHLPWRTAAVLTLTLFLALHFAAVWQKHVRNQLRLDYWPTVAFLRQNTRPGDRILAPSQFLFGLYPDRPFTDDKHYGFHSGLRGKYLVIERAFDIRIFRRYEEPVYRFRREIEERYPVVFQNKAYSVYRDIR